MAIQLKSLDELKKMRLAGIVVGEALLLMKEAAQIGVTTLELDAIAAEHLRARGATSSFLGYHGYPNVLCASVNHEIVHGIPNERKLQNGDVLSIDFGAIVDGWHGDSAISFGIGDVDPADQKLMDTCDESMWRGIAAAKVGGHLTDISAAIQSYIDSQGKYGILREYGGHGIGTEMHQEPHVLNFGKPGMGPELEVGISLAIEPMITRGSATTRTLSDDWTVVSIDKSNGAHFEQSFALLPDGKPYVLTSLDGGRERLGRLGVEISSALDGVGF